MKFYIDMLLVNGFIFVHLLFSDKGQALLCLNSGTELNDTDCKCPPIYKGPTCADENPYPCEHVTCMNNGTCIQGECNCPVQFIGPKCEQDAASFKCLDYCENGGIPRIDPQGACECDCLGVADGDHCEQPNACFEFHCGGGNCSVEDNKAFCQCPDGATGVHCDQTNLGPDPCINKNCNSGKCVALPNGHGSLTAICVCFSNVTGPECDQMSNATESPCDPQNVIGYTDEQLNCYGHGTCGKASKDEVKKPFSCSCPKHYTGEFCEVKSPCYEVKLGTLNTFVSVCEHEMPCESTGVDAHEFKCSCGYAYKGKRCNKVWFKQCVNQTACGAHGECKPCRVKQEEDGILVSEKACKLKPSRDFWCDCNPDYEGRDCNVTVALCERLSGYCKNRATCHEINGTEISCECPPGFNGTYCDRVMDACAAHRPCFNGAPCSPSLEDPGYACKCGSGWKGRQCARSATKKMTQLKFYIGLSIGIGAGYLVLVIVHTIVTWPTAKKVEEEREQKEKLLKKKVPKEKKEKKKHKKDKLLEKDNKKAKITKIEAKAIGSKTPKNAKKKAEGKFSKKSKKAKQA